MKLIIKIIIFLVIAVVLIEAALWYNGRQNQKAQQAAQAAGQQQEQQAQQQSQQQQQSVAQIMQQFKIVDTVVGTGPAVVNGDSVTVNYVGTLDNGTTFDSSYSRNQPFTFTVGAGSVIQGWDLGLVGMKAGGTRQLTIPPQLAYGANSPSPAIPANSTLHFTIQLVSINK